MPYSDKLNPTHVENLRKLSALLKSDRIPPPEFSMRSFVATDIDPHELDDDPKLYCGTVACAAGHGPMAGIPALFGERWPSYTLRNFGVSPHIFSLYRTEEQINGFNWLFSAGWTKTDNTAKGAAARIDWYLEAGVPEDFTLQMYGENPLCYSTE